MQLIEPTMEYEKQIREYRKEFIDGGATIISGAGPLWKLDDPKEWVEQSATLKSWDTVPEGFVPAVQYIFVREDDKKIVGTVNVRPTLNEWLEAYGGHIGYAVAPSERRKGYATHMLRETLRKCRELGMDKVLITCEDSNEASRRTIVANGGAYETTVHEPDENVDLERYWFNLRQHHPRGMSASIHLS